MIREATNVAIVRMEATNEALVTFERKSRHKGRINVTIGAIVRIQTKNEGIIKMRLQRSLL